MNQTWVIIFLQVTAGRLKKLTVNRWTRLPFRWRGQGLYNRPLRAQEDQLELPKEIPMKSAHSESSGWDELFARTQGVMY